MRQIEPQIAAERPGRFAKGASSINRSLVEALLTRQPTKLAALAVGLGLAVTAPSCGYAQTQASPGWKPKCRTAWHCDVLTPPHRCLDKKGNPAVFQQQAEGAACLCNDTLGQQRGHIVAVTQCQPLPTAKSKNVIK